MEVQGPEIPAALSVSRNPHGVQPMVIPCPQCGIRNELASLLSNDTASCYFCGLQLNPAEIDRFKLAETIRIGVVDTVYRAVNLADHSSVAIKLPLFGRTGLENEVDQFFRESRELAFIDHPSVIPVDVIGHSPQRQPFLACTFPLQCTTLSDFMANDRTSSRIISIIKDLATTLHFVHTTWGVVQGDMNPASIILDCIPQNPRQSCKPSIFASCLNRLQSIANVKATETPPFASTAFTSPELLNNNASLRDARSDVYGLGAILHLSLFGVPAPGHSASMPRRRTHSDGENDDYLDQLSRISEKAMAEDPRARFQTAEELRGELEQFVA